MIHNKFRYILTLVALFAMTAGAWADDSSETFTTATNETTYNGTHFTITGSRCDGDGFYLSKANSRTVTITSKNGEVITMIEMTYKWGSQHAASTSATAGTVSADGMSVTNINGTTVTISTTAVTEDAIQIDTWKIYYTTAPAGPKVTINDTKTEATLESMPASDLTVDYELVRDMSVKMQAQVGTDPEAQPRYRVQWNGENWVPADMTQQQVAALFSVNDLVENTTLDPKNYFVSIYAVNEQGETTGDPMTFLNFTFAPGRYAVKASAILGSPTYEGETEQSNIFELFQGYEVEIAAKSFATYYKDEALTLDEGETDAALYTISEVTATEAVLSEAYDAVPSNTPLLVFNSSNKARTILLIPTNEPDLALTVAPEFKGTATAKTFSEADMEAANFYVLTDANAFVWVKGAGQIAANKCWLEIPKTAPNNTRAIVFGEDATAISDISGESGLSGDWYDISGRKVSNSQQPKTKGLYINGGRKVVIK